MRATVIGDPLGIRFFTVTDSEIAVDFPASTNGHRSIGTYSPANASSGKGTSSSVDIYYRSVSRSCTTFREPGHRIRRERRIVTYDYASTVRMPGDRSVAVALAYEAVREEAEGLLPTPLPTWATWTVAHFCRDPAETRPTTVGDLLVLGEMAYEIVADGFEERSGLAALPRRAR
jgi:hypothetical protein